jgi:hypothetical protein
MALGRAYLKNPNWVKEGEELLRQVVAEDPRHAAAHLLLGQLYKERGLNGARASMSARRRAGPRERAGKRRAGRSHGRHPRRGPARPRRRGGLSRSCSAGG